MRFYDPDEDAAVVGEGGREETEAWEERGAWTESVSCGTRNDRYDADNRLHDLFDRIAGALPAGEHRPGQLDMARRVARAVAERRHLIVQAGTGTGKSLAYLVPAAVSGRRVVVATATKALQDQLVQKDLPLVASAMGLKNLSFAVLKGRSNYLCRQRAAEVTGLGSPAASEQLPLGTDTTDQSSRFADQVRRILAWSDESATGDRAELDFEPHPRVWAALSVGPRECPGAFRCPSGPVCFAERARALASASDIVIVNTHLYATHVASGGAVLPEHDVLVLDEAHAVEEVMTEGLGVELSGGRLRAVALAARGLLGASDTRIVDSIMETADELDHVLTGLVGRRLMSGGSTSRDDLDRVLALTRFRLETLASALRRGENRSVDADADDNGRMRAVLAVSHVLDDLAAVYDAGDDDVVWVEEDGRPARKPALRLAPIEIGPLLAERVWSKVTSVLTSATIPPLLERRLGLPVDLTDIVDVGSPFPYRDCALLYCPADLPDRRSATAEPAVHDELERIINAAGGRTLALFTSWSAMQKAVEALRPRLGHSVLAQNDLPKARLIELFTEDPATCLFATMSFWQGIDVPGETLSVVAIDRIPFPRPDDPLLQARRERAGQGAFRQVDIPLAATLLAQGAGRLIRSSTDTGMVAVLDSRFAKATYGRVLRQALPPMRFTTRRSEAMSFLGSIPSHG